MGRNRKLVLAIGALLAAAGGGVAIAASGSSPAEENQAVLDDAAKQLGVSPSALSAALKKALSDRIDAAVKAGRLTQEEADALKHRLNSDEFPLFGGFHHGFGHFGFFRQIDAAAHYLGLTHAQLRSELESGKSLAQIAKDHGKSVDGLVDALVAVAKERLDRAVAAGRLTQAEENDMLDGLRDRITSLVSSARPIRDHFFGPLPPFGFRHFQRGPI
jgi:AraC-like DNA-binding protein